MSPRRGQIIIPALFLFPTLMMFVYLIYETAKLSREKIRHQFAIDAAVFVEMTNYSDFLNRTAYVNGAFPMRIFDEGFMETKLDSDMRTGKNRSDLQKTLWWILCKNGVFPMHSGDCQTRSDYNTESGWDIRYGGAGSGKNNSPPDLGGDVMTILTGTNPDDDANAYWLNWDDANQIYKLYVQIYQLLGSVEDAQYNVLNRLSSTHNFLRKSYWLNTGSDLNGAAAASNVFDSGMGSWTLGSNLRYYCYPKVNFYGNKPTGSMFQPWQVYSPDGGAVKMASSINGCDGLFQLMWVSPQVTGNDSSGNPTHQGTLNKPVGSSFYGSRGVPVNQMWGGGGDNNVITHNYFNHDFSADFPGGQPAVHVSVAIDGFGGAKASVWPNPTPKYQVRTYP